MESAVHDMKVSAEKKADEVSTRTCSELDILLGSVPWALIRQFSGARRSRITWQLT